MDGKVDLFSCEMSSTKKVQNLVVKDAESLKPVEERGLGPVTPVPDRINGESVTGSDTPLTWVSSPLKSVSADSDGAEVSGCDSNAQTPKCSVFDPFAPGPDELMFAPRKKNMEECRIRPMRRLNFDSYDISMENVGENDVLEESFLETVYESFLDAIVSNQAEEILDENPTLNLGFCDGFKTPTSSPPLKGFAETCPEAPMKPARESRKIDLGICRKLEF